MRYSAFGEMRYLNGETVTDLLYTGQKLEEELGLYYYVARWYDPYLNRFLSPDTIMPDGYEPMSYNRYTYANNNPLKYTDATGHFSEDDLIDWYGEGWRNLFSEGWQAVLIEAEFGDVVGHGSFEAIFAIKDGKLATWDINNRQELSIDQLVAGSGELALYRSCYVNLDGGPSQFGRRSVFRRVH